MTQLTEDVFAVEVPDKGRKFRAQRPYKTSSMRLHYKYGIEEQWNYIKLPPGTWQILCTTKEATEEQAKGIVEHDTFIGGYKDYDTERFHHEDPFIKATDSLNSLITSKGLDVNKNYVLLKKKVI